jgi:predicted RNA-binding Zn-ribbon protein involved in translation (DUF1610 family)
MVNQGCMSAMLPPTMLRCSLCGSQLKATPDVGRYVCPNCGSEVSTNRSNNNFSTEPVVAAVSKVQLSTDKTAAELAIQRLQKELGALQIQRQQIANEYQESGTSGKLNSLGIGLVVTLLFFVMGLGYDLYTEKELIGIWVGSALGVIAAIIIHFIYGKQLERSSQEIAKSLQKDLSACDRRIYETKKRLTNNLMVVNSE